ncbi:MAG TPA: hypothetical protein PK744_10800, partial [Pseudomonadales bacterium]|nr:hypothetical protein [Pseudomonadales bacterium]
LGRAAAQAGQARRDGLGQFAVVRDGVGHGNRSGAVVGTEVLTIPNWVYAAARVRTIPALVLFVENATGRDIALSA